MGASSKRQGHGKGPVAPEEPQRKSPKTEAAHGRGEQAQDEAMRKYFFGDIYKDGKYTPLHQAMFALEGAAKLKEWLAPCFVRAVEAARSGGDPRKYLTEELPGVYSFEMFTEEFCQMLLQEIEHAQRTSRSLLERPNGMNRYGLVLNQLGLEPLITCLQQEYVLPLQAILYPEQGSGADDHHCFIVRYAAEEDVGLDMHEDDSDVTLNVCLGKTFTAATLSFCGMAAEADHRKLRHTYAHSRGRGLVHLGHHRHGADNIESGERVNFILWSTSSSYRASEAYHRNRMRRAGASAPDPICLSYTHDHDYLQYLPAPSEQDALARGVMLDRVARRQMLRKRPVHDLANAIQEINEVPSAVLFLEGARPEIQKQLFQELALYATEVFADEGEAEDGQLPSMLFFVALRPVGAVPQVRRVCGVSGSPALAVLDIERECVSRFQGELLGAEELRLFLQAYRDGEITSTPVSAG